MIYQFCCMNFQFINCGKIALQELYTWYIIVYGPYNIGYIQVATNCGNIPAKTIDAVWRWYRQFDHILSSQRSLISEIRNHLLFHKLSNFIWRSNTYFLAHFQMVPQSSDVQKFSFAVHTLISRALSVSTVEMCLQILLSRVGLVTLWTLKIAWVDTELVGVNCSLVS